MIMSFIKKSVSVLTLILVLGVSGLRAQTPMAYLEETFPKLTDRYRAELQGYKAHYTFAIDVSGTMRQYSDLVSSTLVPFFQALPDGDVVDVIPFGTEPRTNMSSYCGTISTDKRAVSTATSRMWVT